MNVLVTGASGFVGRNVLLEIPKDWNVTALYHNAMSFPVFLNEHGLAHVKSLRLDLTDTVATKQALGQNGFDVCLHFAAHGDPREANKDPALDLVGNTLTLLNLLTSGVRIKRFVLWTSGSVYEGLTGPVGAQSQLKPFTAYSIAKYANEQYVRFFAREQVIEEYVIIRFFGCYGPYEPERKIYGRLVRAFGMEGLKDITLYGDGSNKIYAMYAKDAAKGAIAAAQGIAKNIIVDFCGEEHTTIKELAQKASSLFGVDANIEFTGEKPVEEHKFSVSNDAFEAAFKYRPTTRLADGLQTYKEFLIHG